MFFFHYDRKCRKYSQRYILYFLNCDEFCITVLSMIRPPQAFLNCQKISAPFVTLYDKVLSCSLGVAGPVRSHDM